MVLSERSAYCISFQKQNIKSKVARSWRMLVTRRKHEGELLGGGGWRGCISLSRCSLCGCIELYKGMQGKCQMYTYKICFY